MKTVLSTLLVILVFNLSGCTCEPKIEYKIKYINKPIPSLPVKPVATEYSVIQVNFNGSDYYALTKADAVILESNWVSYRSWCETNRNLLNLLKD